MKWEAKAIDTYLQAKEYVDTAIVPLVPIAFANEVKSTVAMGEFITIISSEIERQFQGRVIQFPPFTYLKSESFEKRIARLHEWNDELNRGGMKHLIMLTSDGEWKTVEEKVTGELIWLPTIPMEHVDPAYKKEIITDQVKQVIPILTSKWQAV